ncbi:LysM peptidoglycan-binding domain-containing protein [Oricola cellulosilytica]|uniref:LysM peptidoglycan-binding domain-containing protein n=1 Tax=Oricola cellulosilytica TaxID=1429082 RepID=A0A4R0PAK7_9HYPH|nr:LysM peptidoglycan-binding domain-containing protein [Oricola cellulosilytica]TCD14280.1 LysM peptidoglycan-binding domain-containing protein [Oricola cellulosilytica]
MNKGIVAAGLVGGVIAVVAVLSLTPVSERVETLLGRNSAAVRTSSPGTGAPSSGQERVPNQSTLAEKDGEASTTEMASVSRGENGTGGKADRIMVPTFGLLRVEPDGSTVIAGQAGPNAEIEVLAGADMIASARAEGNGDFVAVLDTPLAPGDYEIVLRAIDRDGSVAMSSETAVVSVPQPGDEGSLLALVEEPGAPSRLITTPEPTATVLREVQKETAGVAALEEPSGGEASTADSDVTEGATETQIAVAQDGIAEAGNAATDGEAAGSAKIADETAVSTEAARQSGTEAASVPPGQVAAAPRETGSEQSGPPAQELVRIEAVEIEGETVFVAGAAPPGAQVRVYANDLLLGDTRAGPSGRFLVQANRNLPVGDYIMRADVIERGTSEVTARAAVPFSRAEGERIAAVAVEAGQAASSAEAGQGSQSAEPAATGEKVAAASVPRPETALPTAPPAIEADVPQTTGQLRRTNSSVIIRRGDTLWHISRRIYGKGLRFTTIYLANQTQIADPDLIWPGQVFELPEKALSDNDETSSVN